MRNFSFIIGLLLILQAFLCPMQAQAESKIDFLEKYVLKDKSKALKSLIQGTPDYYYYHCLNALAMKDQKSFETLLKEYKKKYEDEETDGFEDEGDRISILEVKGMLRQYGVDGAAALPKIMEYLDINYDIEEIGVEIEPNKFPNKLPPEYYNTERLIKKYFDDLSLGMSRVEPAGYERFWILSSGTERQEDLLLSNHPEPTWPGLIKAMAKSLNENKKRSFSDFPYRSQLFKSQLEELNRLVPALLEDNSYVNLYLEHIVPSLSYPSEQEREEILDQKIKFSEKLGAKFNSLKATFLLRKLWRDKNKRKYDEVLFRKFLAIPSAGDWVLPERYKDIDGNILAHPTARDGSIRYSQGKIIAEYLEYFLAKADNYDSYKKYLKDEYLRERFARAKLLAGKATPEITAMLDLETVKELKERVEVKFAPDNPKYFKAQEDVSLRLLLKNTPNIQVKVYRINASNYFKLKDERIDPDLNIDGLKPNYEYNFKIDAVPVQRVSQIIRLPDLKDPGIYLVDVQGNGLRARAVISKGRLFLFPSNTARGVGITVLDEEQRIVEGAKLDIGGKVYISNKDGKVLLPYSNSSSRKQKIIVSKGKRCSVVFIRYPTLDYKLSGGIFISEESLIAGHKAKVIVSPRLWIGGNPTSLKYLKNVNFRIRANEEDAGSNTKSQILIKDIKLSNLKDFVYEFTVPPQPEDFRFELTAELHLPGERAPRYLSLTNEIAVGNLSNYMSVREVYLAREGEGYRVYLLGKNGEPMKHQAALVKVKNHFTTRTRSMTLQSDEKGIIRLGKLDDIKWVEISMGSKSFQRRFFLKRNNPFRTSEIVIKPETEFELTCQLENDFGKKKKVSLNDFSLLQVRFGMNLKNAISFLKVDGQKLVFNKLPSGEYNLTFRPTGAKVKVVVFPHKKHPWISAGKNTAFYSMPISKLAIPSIVKDGKQLVIKVEGSSVSTRVHIVGTFFKSRKPSILEGIEENYNFSYPKRYFAYPVSSYKEAVGLDYEARYIFSRQRSKKYAGNLLEQPGLLLNPVETEETEEDDGTGGRKWRVRHGGGSRRTESGRRGRREAKTQIESDDFLQFLAKPALVMANLKPDKNGEIRIDEKALEGVRVLVVTAVDSFAAVSAQWAPSESPVLKTRNLRLAKPLDPKKNFGLENKCLVFKKGEKFTIELTGKNQFQVYDSMAALFHLFQTVNEDTKLDEFSFLVGWSGLTPERKLELYSKYSCHELNYFLSVKDKPFFKKHVKPYLSNKMHKTFLDKYLLGESLEFFIQEAQFSSLNVFEKLLLEKRLKRPATVRSRWVKDQVETIGYSEEDEADLIKAALNAFGLEGKDTLSSFFEKAQKGFDAEDKDDSEYEPEIERELVEEAKGIPEFDGYEKMEVYDNSLYYGIDPTREYMENNYYRIPMEEQDEELVTASPFWETFAGKDAPFLSDKVAFAHRNLTEMLLSLGITDLPEKPVKHGVKIVGKTMEVTFNSNAVVFLQQVVPLKKKKEVKNNGASLMVNCRYFYNEKAVYSQSKIERDGLEEVNEFQPGRIYSSNTTFVNPTKDGQSFDFLGQIPAGTIVFGQEDDMTHLKIHLGPYSAKTITSYFYFPEKGNYEHVPAQVYSDGKLITSVPPRVLKVKKEFTQVDKSKWNWISVKGTDKEVLAYLEKANPDDINFSSVEDRLKKKSFYDSLMKILRERHYLDGNVYEYSFMHKDLEGVRTYLKKFAEDEISFPGYFDSRLFRQDPVEEKLYEHLEYKPLIIARIHQLPGESSFFNDQMKKQYYRLLRNLSTRPMIDNTEKLQVAYYMLLQNRIEEAIDLAGQVAPTSIPMRLQYDYLSCYLAFYEEKLEEAKTVASRYKEYPVVKWRNRFLEVLSQIETAQTGVIAKGESREAELSRLADTEETLEFKVEENLIKLSHENTDKVKVNFYLMDIETLFSRTPFATKDSKRFAFVEPTHSIDVQLKNQSGESEIRIPEILKKESVLVEIISEKASASRMVFRNNLRIRVASNYGRIKVANAKTGKPAVKVYVKVYARTNGKTVFHKDGYTDVRGVFDYVTLSTVDDPVLADDFAILVFSEADGSAVLEERPPLH